MYWEGDDPGDRDFQKGHDPNDREKKEIVEDVINKIIEHVPKIKCDFKKNDEKEEIYKILKDHKAEIFNILEYHWAVHAEDAAICDAAMRGISIRGATIYCTTFPCHICTKHIIAVGISRVVYIHPYPKSRAEKLFNDMIVLPNKKFQLKMVIYEPFIGVAPRRLLKIFIYEPGVRKNNGKKIDWNINDQSSPFLVNRTPLAYYDKETAYIYSLYKKIKDLVKNSAKKSFDEAKNEYSNMVSSKQKWANDEASEINNNYRILIEKFKK